MGYRPDITFRLDITMPYPHWLNGVEDAVKAELVKTMSEIAERFHARCGLGLGDSMEDAIPPYRHAMEQLMDLGLEEDEADAILGWEEKCFKTIAESSTKLTAEKTK